MIRFSNVTKSYDNGRTCVLEQLSLQIQSGEIFILLGSSGSGKTTALKMINRLIEPDAGDIEIDGQNIKHGDPLHLRRAIGYVVQGIGLFPHMTVAENIAAGLRLINKPKAQCDKRARELLSFVQLNPEEYANRFPDELSGGQQQRIGVARALATDPTYLLMDEPFGALDAITRSDLQNELLQLQKELRKTIVFVTHDIAEAFRLGDRIAILHKGRLEQVGTKEQLIAAPASDWVWKLLAGIDARISH